METVHAKEILNTLTDLGIESKQADVYASALVLGGGTIAELARAANIERTGIYYHINQMVNRGLLKTSRRGQRIIYLPTDPNKLKEILEKKSRSLENTLPKMQKLFSQQSGKSLITYYEGKDGIINLYAEQEHIMSEMSEDETLYVIARPFLGYEVLPEMFTKFFERRAKMKVQTKAIFPISEKPKAKDENSTDQEIRTKYALHVQERKYIPDQYMFENLGTIIVARDYIWMIDYRTLFGSFTENKNLANTWRMFFKFIWEHL